MQYQKNKIFNFYTQAVQFYDALLIYNCGKESSAFHSCLTTKFGDHHVIENIVFDGEQKLLKQVSIRL